MKKKLLSYLMIAVLLVSLLGMTGCGGSKESSAPAADSKATLNIAYQYGLAYAPLAVLQDQKLIEAKYKELTGKEVEVVWNQMSSGPDINTGISSGSIDIGFMGVAPAVTGVTKKVGYKIFTNLSGQGHGLMTNKSEYTSLGDMIGSAEQIALVNIGSIQHIILAKALADNGYDPHALDSNLVAMKHPDGMAALQSGSAAFHLTSNPYIYKERESGMFSELPEVADAWTVEDSFIVGVAAEAFHDGNADLYKAVCEAVAGAVDYVNNNMEETAKLTCELDGNTYEDELKYMQLGRYSVETSNVLALAQFMAESEFIEGEISSYNDLVYDNVKGN